MKSSMTSLRVAALAAATAWCSIPSPAIGQSTSPPAPVNALYTWYVKSHGWWGDHLEDARSLLDPGLYDKLATVIALQKRVRFEVIDFDYWTDAQAPAEAYTTGVPALHGDAYWIPVKLTIPNWKEQPVLTMVVRKDASGSYRIYDVIYPARDSYPAYDLRGYLDKVIKENSK